MYLSHRSCMIVWTSQIEREVSETSYTQPASKVIMTAK